MCKKMSILFIVMVRGPIACSEYQVVSVSKYDSLLLLSVSLDVRATQVSDEGQVSIYTHAVFDLEAHSLYTYAHALATHALIPILMLTHLHMCTHAGTR